MGWVTSNSLFELLFAGHKNAMQSKGQAWDRAHFLLLELPHQRRYPMDLSRYLAASCLLATLIIFSSSSVAQDDADHPPAKFSISVTPMAALSYPNFKFGDNYSPCWGGGAKGCLNINFMEGNGGFDLGMSWYDDQFKAKGVNKIADMNSLGLFIDMYDYFIVSGTNLGASQFSANDDIYDNFGKKTGTEFGARNREVTFSYSRYSGLRVPIGPWVAIDGEYQLVSVETSYMFWHNFLSGGIAGLSMLPFTLATMSSMANESIPGVIVSELLGAAVSWAWYYFGYQNHDWPWHDPSPMCFPRCLLGVTFNIGRWVID
jgi:hypothetical protein